MRERILILWTILFLSLSNQLFAQDEIHLKSGEVVSCRIIEISDFILYAELNNEPYPLTYFSDDVAFLKVDPRNAMIVRQLQREVKEAMKYSNILEENAIHGFYFGMPYDSIQVKATESLYKTDTNGNPILVPYDPQNTAFNKRLKSLAKSIGGSSLAWILGL